MRHQEEWYRGSEITFVSWRKNAGDESFFVLRIGYFEGGNLYETRFFHAGMPGF